LCKKCSLSQFQIQTAGNGCFYIVSILWQSKWPSIILFIFLLKFTAFKTAGNGCFLPDLFFGPENCLQSFFLNLQQLKLLVLSVINLSVLLHLKLYLNEFFLCS